jgi:hypothetical protein
MMTVHEILTKLIRIELLTNANKLNFIDLGKIPLVDEKLLIESISVLNELSIKKDEMSKRQLIAICALVWTYRDFKWDGLKDYLILFLSRAGFGPSSIMLDSEYSYQNRQFSFGESILNQFAVTLEQVRNEVQIGNEVFLLSDFQKEIWHSIDGNALLGISAPTSAGKSFLILLKSIELLRHKKGVIIYVVPTLSLVSQVLADFRCMLDRFKMSEFSLETTYSSTSANERSIYVLTQEKAIASFSQVDTPFPSIRLLVIDEIQNVEKVGDSDDQRSKVLYDLMIELRSNSSIDHIIISGPRILKIDELGERLFGIKSFKNETEASPVLNLTYSISKKKEVYYFNIYSDLVTGVEQIKITKSNAIEGYGKVTYSESYLGYLNKILESFGEDECCLIFSPTSVTSSKMAEYLALQKPLAGKPFLESLADFIERTVHSKFTLVETLRKGVAYHHGKLPFHVRLLIEDGLKKKEIKTVICTTTLLQGVNLPVQNIIIRNPNLFIQKKNDSSRLSNYEIANLRGRAGRLLKDFVGRTFILDELSFQEKNSKQLDLFENTSKELQVGYGPKFLENKDRITSDLRNMVGSTIENKGYSYLTTYLRQVVLRYGLSAQTYLARVGIILSDTDLNMILVSLSGLTVTREICSKNRYWDPIDLNNLALRKNRYNIPNSLREFNLSYRLKEILLLMQNEFPAYYERYFSIKNFIKPNGREVDRILQFCILAEKWLKERPLAEMLSEPYYNSSEVIDDTISFLQNKISYGLPLLLKPLYDIKEPDSMFTRYIEMGAYLPLTRKFIELGIPRETAIFLNGNFQFENIDDKTAIIEQLRRLRGNLSYWHQVQLTAI